MRTAILLFLSIGLFYSNSIFSQPVYITRSGKISFFSETPIEDIKALNQKVYSSLNVHTGSLQFLLKITDFNFRYAAMKKHFNDEEYMHSKKFPNAYFKGNIINKESFDLSNDGTYKVMVEGELNMHGVANKIKIPATLVANKGSISAIAVFPVRLEDYKVRVPKIMIKKIAEIVEVTVNCEYQVFKN